MTLILNNRDSDMQRWGKADLHLHTCHDAWGDGNDSVAAIFEHVENHTDLDLLSITDHDSTEGARAGRELHDSGTYRFDFVPGVEVTTTAGHLLCYFPSEFPDVPSLRSLSWTTSFVHERGGFCVMAHPVYPPWLRRSLLKPRSRTIQMVEAVESINGGLTNGAQDRLNEVGRALLGRTGLVGNSDAHHKEAIGSVVTEFPGSSLDDYLQALKQRTSRPVRRAHVEMPRRARSFTRRRSMTRPGWVRNVYRAASGRHHTSGTVGQRLSE